MKKAPLTTPPGGGVGLTGAPLDGVSFPWFSVVKRVQFYYQKP